MKTKTLLCALLSLLLLSGCETRNDSGSDSKSDDTVSTTSDPGSGGTTDPTTNDPDSNDPTTNDPDTGDEPDIKKEPKLVTIKELKEEGEKYKAQVNDAGVYVSSDYYVKIENLQLISLLDAITTRGDYNISPRYKALMSDGSDYLYVQCEFEKYKQLKDYVEKHQTYNVTGYLAIYLNEVELVSDADKDGIKYQGKGSEIDIDYFDIVKETYTITDIYNHVLTLRLNCKGNAYSKLVKFKAYCLGKDIDSKVAYFGLNNDIIVLHGHEKVVNKFTLHSFYELVVAITVFHFRPGVEYVDSKPGDPDGAVLLDEASLSTMKCEDFYKYQYKKDDDNYDPKFENYSNFFRHPVKVKCYLNFYLIDAKYYAVLEDKYQENLYKTKQQAKDKKTLFIANKDAKSIENLERNPISYLVSDSPLELVVFPYLWHDDHYPSVYVYNLSEIAKNAKNETK